LQEFIGLDWRAAYSFSTIPPTARGDHDVDVQVVVGKEDRAPRGYSLMTSLHHAATWYPVRMAQAEPDRPRRPANAFERFVMRIAAVPKAKVDALEAAEKARPGVRPGPKPKRPRTKPV